MKFLLDMNLSPDWIEVFTNEGWSAIHWSKVGDPTATDRVLMDWARVNDYIVFTHDLDFGILLALTHDGGPSVIQIRIQDIMPASIKNRLVSIIKKYSLELQRGALVTIDPYKSRIRVLPIP
jgi:predicted nuclease of predicted toxin-antitoxin system